MGDLNRPISKSRINKAPGKCILDMNSSKTRSSFSVKINTMEFNRIFDENIIPLSSCTKTIIFLLHKKGSLNDIQNYHGLNLLAKFQNYILRFYRKG